MKRTNPPGRAAEPARPQRLGRFYPVSRSWVGLPSIALLAIAATSALAVRDWNYVDLRAVSALPRASSALAGPLVAVAAAAFAVRRCGPCTPLALPVAHRCGWRAVGAHLSSLVPTWTAAYAVGFVPVIVAARGRAEFGQMDWAVVAGGLVVLAAFITAGYCAGVMLPLRLTPMGVGVATLLIVAARDYVPESSWLALPAWPAVESTTRAANAIFPWLHMGLFAVVALCSVILAAGVQGLRAWWGARPPWQPLLALAPAVLAVWAASATGLSPSGSEPAGPRACQDMDGVEVCVHAVKQSVLGSVVAMSSGVFSVLGGMPPGLAGVSDDSLVPRGELSRSRPGVALITVPRDLPLDAQAPRQLAGWAAGLEACFILARDRLEDEEPLEFGMVFTEWLLDEAGYASQREQLAQQPPMAAQLARLDRAGVEAVAAWYHRHAPDVQACRAPTGELGPWS